MNDKYTSGPIPLASGVKKSDQIYKKRVRDTKVMVLEVDKDTPIRARKRVKEASLSSLEPPMSLDYKF